MNLPLPASRRDRQVLAVGAIIAVVLLAWALAWEPLRRERLSLRDEVTANADLLAAARAAPAGARTVRVAAGTSLLARADASARAAGLGEALGSLEPQGADALRLQLEDVGFDALAGWLQSLAAQGIVVESVNAQRAAGAGQVTARVVLRDRGS